MKYRYYPALFVALGFVRVVDAANPAPLDPVVVTATRTPQPISNLLSDVRVIDEAMIDDSGAENFTELLQIYGGAEISAAGGRGQQSSVFLRGTNSNHVVLLVDGVRVNSATTGTNAFENIPVSQIERIEILRGPASSLYGADAVGGVIQIFTKQEEGAPHLSILAGAGTYNTQLTEATIGGKAGNTRFSVHAGYEETKGFSATNQAAGSFYFNPDKDGYRNQNASLNITQHLLEGHDVALGAWQSEGVTHFDAGLGSDNVTHHRLSNVYLQSRDRLTTGWQSRVTAARGTDDLVFSNGFNALYRTDQNQFSWQNDINAPGGKVIAALEYRRENVESDTAFTQTSRITRSAFAAYIGGFDRHLLQTSIRRDDISQFEAHNTGSLAYGYRITPLIRATASIASAFKVPTFNDLYDPFIGNVNVKPERALNREVGLQYNADGKRAGLIVFVNRIHDFITTDSNFIPINVEARIRGATLSYSGYVGDYRITADVTHQKPEEAATGNLLPRRARNFASSSIIKNWEKWEFGSEVVVSGERFDKVSNASSTRLGGYGLVNLLARYEVTKEVTARIRWNNVFDKQYELSQGYNTPGSNVFVSLEYAPK